LLQIVYGKCRRVAGRPVIRSVSRYGKDIFVFVVDSLGNAETREIYASNRRLIEFLQVGLIEKSPPGSLTADIGHHHCSVGLSERMWIRRRTAFKRDSGADFGASVPDVLRIFRVAKSVIEFVLVAVPSRIAKLFGDGAKRLKTSGVAHLTRIPKIQCKPA